MVMGHALYHAIKSVEPPVLSVFLRAIIFLLKLGFLQYSEILSEIVLNTNAFVSELVSTMLLLPKPIRSTLFRGSFTTLTSYFFEIHLNDILWFPKF